MNRKDSKSQRTIRRNLKELRDLIDSTSDPVVARVAYAMETAIRWATEDTYGWQEPREEALLLAEMLRRELGVEAVVSTRTSV